ncbi:MAG: TonB-dependent receptor domain-containing protein, partial [Steroidobacteraceae bacterium]
MVTTKADLQLTGKTDISDVINQLPQNFNNALGQDYGNGTSGLSTAGGVATADLRGLGANRTLVLVDGIRLGQGSPYTFFTAPAPDLDQIPAALIERVEVVTGGASAVYGSDAIAGVINFILQKNFQGIKIDGQLGENWHNNSNGVADNLLTQAGETPVSGNINDGRQRNFNVVVGTNFADGKGNVTGYLGYMQNDAVPGSQRDFSQCQLNETFDANGNVNGIACGGSSNSNWFQPETGANAGTIYSVNGHSFVPRGSVPTTPPAEFNAQPFIYMGRADQRYQAGFMAHDDVTDYIRPYAEMYFMDDKSNVVIAPAALFKDSNPLDPNTGNYNINCSNPLLSAQQAAILCTPAQIAADAATPGSVTENVRIGRRNIEGGGRTSFYEHTNYRAVLGSKGELGEAWNYDVYAQYTTTSFFNSNNKYLSFQSIDNALLVTGTAANPKCISGGACVPYDIFQDGGVTDQQLNYLNLTGTGQGTSTLRTIHADITGELGQYGVKSPVADEGVAVNVGVEHRNDHEQFQPDSAEQSGLLSGFGSAAVAINNSISVDEEFIEVRAPLVQDKTGVKDLLFDTGYRRSDYSVSGTVNTYKFEVQYAPIRDVRFRGSYNRAIRAPSVLELYVPQLVGTGQFGNDPCAPTVDNGVLTPATASLAQCMHSGVTAAQYGNGGTTDTIPQGTAGQLSQLTGGNLKLTPEQGTSYSFGVSINPTALPNLTGSLDYYRIDLKNLVGVLPAGVIIPNCLNTGNPTFCSQLVRSPNTGGLTGNSLASGGYIVQTNVNVGAGKVSGIDGQLAYKQPLPSHWGALGFALNGAYLLHMESTPLPGAHTYDCAGLFGFTCQTINPRWHHIFRTSWLTPWNVTAALTWRYIGSVK